MFQYNSEDYQRLLKLNNIIDLIENKTISLEQEHFISTLFNLNKSSYIKYPKFINV